MLHLGLPLLHEKCNRIHSSHRGSKGLPNFLLMLFVVLVFEEEDRGCVACSGDDACVSVASINIGGTSGSATAATGI